MTHGDLHSSLDAAGVALQVARTLTALAGGGALRPVAVVEAVQYSSRRLLWGVG